MTTRKESTEIGKSISDTVLLYFFVASRIVQSRILVDNSVYRLCCVFFSSTFGADVVFFSDVGLVDVVMTKVSIQIDWKGRLIH